MGNYPAICMRCGKAVSSGISVEGAKNVKITNCSTGNSCPRCGGLLIIPNGGTDDSGNIYFESLMSDFFQKSNATKSDFIKLSSIVEKAQDRNLSENEFYKSIEEKATQLAGIIPIIKKQNNRMEFYAILGLLFVILQKHISNDESASETHRVIIDNEIVIKEKTINKTSSEREFNRAVKENTIFGAPEKINNNSTANITFHQLEFNRKKSGGGSGLCHSRIKCSITIGDQKYSDLYVNLLQPIGANYIADNLEIHVPNIIKDLLPIDKFKFNVSILYKSELEKLQYNNMEDLDALTNTFIINRNFLIQVPAGMNN